MKKYLFILVGILTLVSSVFGNNVRMKGSAVVTDVSGGVATVEFSLEWDNAWRDSYNWDAVWVFLKYKKGVESNWTHVNMQASGHEFLSGNIYTYTYFPGTNGSTTVGLFVLLNEMEEGSASMTCKIKCNIPGVTQADFDNNDAFILAQGIEMVYIPYGPFQLGEKDKLNSFDSVFIDSELSKSLAIHSGTAITPAANYPKGYNGFHVMKYETSQEQYVTFLNALTRDQQESLITNHGALEPGNYVFGKDPLRASYRNGIILSQKPSDITHPMVFDNNLTSSVDGKYGQSDDGQYIPCNYMSATAMQAYCSWAGLRPMSELEFEKACRLPFPDKPDDNEYVWNLSTAPDFPSSVIKNPKTEIETPSGGQVNAGGRIQGPLRCGSFATKSTTQQTSGGTFWGLMDMSGNLREIYTSVKNTSSSSSSHGSGSLSINSWGTDPTWFGYRGGSFASDVFALQTADRSEMALSIAIATGDSITGFRGVRSFDGSGITIDAGEIVLASTTACPRELVNINGTDAVITGPDGVLEIPITYIWLINGIVQDGVDVNLKLDSLPSGKTHTIVRKAVCMMGVAPSVTLEVPVPASVSFNLSHDFVVIGTEVTATANLSQSLTYSWISSDGAGACSENKYTPLTGHFNNGTHGRVTCTALNTGCTTGGVTDTAIVCTMHAGSISYSTDEVHPLKTKYIKNDIFATVTGDAPKDIVYSWIANSNTPTNGGGSINIKLPAGEYRIKRRAYSSTLGHHVDTEYGEMYAVKYGPFPDIGWDGANASQGTYNYVHDGHYFYNHANATKYCKDRGKRLPTLEEVEALILSGYEYDHDGNVMTFGGIIDLYTAGYVDTQPYWQGRHDTGFYNIADDPSAVLYFYDQHILYATVVSRIGYSRNSKSTRCVRK